MKEMFGIGLLITAMLVVFAVAVTIVVGIPAVAIVWILETIMR